MRVYRLSARKAQRSPHLPRSGSGANWAVPLAAAVFGRGRGARHAADRLLAGNKQRVTPITSPGVVARRGLGVGRAPPSQSQFAAAPSLVRPRPGAPCWVGPAPGAGQRTWRSGALIIRAPVRCSSHLRGCTCGAKTGQNKWLLHMWRAGGRGGHAHTGRNKKWRPGVEPP
jgi:hypothetical protein